MRRAIGERQTGAGRMAQYQEAEGAVVAVDVAVMEIMEVGLLVKQRGPRHPVKR